MDNSLSVDVSLIVTGSHGESNEPDDSSTDIKILREKDTPSK